MTDFFQTGLGTAVLMVAQSVLIVGFVMISLLFLVYGDRKIWAVPGACCNRWPMR
jgi:NADH-quinone oxidoreductase subunit H